MNYKFVILRVGGIIYKVGVSINGIQFWHFKKGDYIRGAKMGKDGVSIIYPDGVKRIIMNSWYDETDGL